MRFGLLLAINVAIVNVNAAAHGFPGRLNDTGQTVCIDSTGQIVRQCKYTGLDAEYGRDARLRKQSDGHNGFAFGKVCNNGHEQGSIDCTAIAQLGPAPSDWGCTRDLNTGLLWEIKTDDGGPRDRRRTFTNYGDQRAGDSGSYVALLNNEAFCGKTDWRMPTLDELFGLVDVERTESGLSIDETWFPNTAIPKSNDGQFVSYSALAHSETFSDAVLFKDASVNLNYPTSYHTGLRLVSGGSHPRPNRFQVRLDEVKDRYTGLIWQRCPVGQTFTGVSCTGVATHFRPSLAGVYAQQFAAKTHQPWRVPNIKELASLIVHNDAQTPGSPLVLTQSDQWTSATLFAREASYMVNSNRIAGFTFTEGLLLMVRDAGEKIPPRQ